MTTYTAATQAIVPTTTHRATRRSRSERGTDGISAGGVDEGEHGLDPSVGLSFVEETELEEHRADVLLDRAFTHVERGGDGRVVAAGRHLLQHRTLLVGQTAQGGARLARLAPHQPFDHLRVECGPAAGNLAQGADELVDVRDPLLEQVAEP